RLRKPPTTPNALTPSEVNAIRTAIAFWETGLSPSGPKPDGQLGAIIEVMLGTSARIGEVSSVGFGGECFSWFQIERRRVANWPSRRLRPLRVAVDRARHASGARSTSPRIPRSRPRGH